MGKTQGIVGAGSSGRTGGRAPATERRSPLADAGAFQSHLRRHRQNPIFTKAFVDNMALSLREEMMVPDHNGNFSAPDPERVEKLVANFSGGEYLHGKKYFDALVTTGRANKPNTGLEVKLCANITESTPPVLGQVGASDVIDDQEAEVGSIEASDVVSSGESLDTLDPAEVGRRVCRVERLKKEETNRLLRDEGLSAPAFSELMIFWGDRKTQSFKVWTEPYEVDEQLADRLVWRKMGKSFQAFEPAVCQAAESESDLKGKHLLEWFPKNGALRYKVNGPPTGVETADIPWPHRKFTERELDQINGVRRALCLAADMEADPGEARQRPDREAAETMASQYEAAEGTITADSLNG